MGKSILRNEGGGMEMRRREADFKFSSKFRPSNFLYEDDEDEQ